MNDKNLLQSNANSMLENQLRKAFTNEEVPFKNVTFSLPEDTVQKIEEVIDSNKNIQEKLKISGLPITKSDLIINAIEVYTESYFQSIGKLVEDFPEISNEMNVDVYKDSVISPTSADTIIVAARTDGFNKVFLEDHEWYKVRVAKWRLPHLKYLGVYVGTPISKVTHYARIDSYTQLKDGKYKFFLSDIQELETPIVLSEYDTMALKQTVYTTLAHLKSSKYLFQLSQWWQKNK